MVDVITSVCYHHGLLNYSQRKMTTDGALFHLPYCWERISMILDPEEETSDYIEDCEICCRPIELFFRFSEENLVSFKARKMEGI